MKAKLFIIALLIASMMPVYGQMPAFGHKNPYSIIPEPVQMNLPEQIDTVFRLKRGATIVVADQELLPSATYLADYTNKYLGIPLTISKKAKKDTQNIVLTLAPAASGIRETSGNISGGYGLKINGLGISIEGNDAAGVFYGIQTLIQMLPTRAGVTPLFSSVEIIDYPRFEYRGLMLDVVRHFFPVDFIKRYIDYIALHKMNYFHWHLTDDQGWRVEMKSHPELTEIGAFREGEIEGLYPGKYRELPYGGYYTQEEIREVVEYAAQRYITVIPEIDIPGHCMALLSVHPEFSTTPDEPKKAALTWGIYNKFNNVLAPTPEVFSFLTDVFSELCDLFPSQYIHVGGDECAKKWWQESEMSQEFIKANGLEDENALQSYFVHYVQKVVNGKGKTLIGWDEILEGGISNDCVVMNWRGQNHGIKAAQTGHKVISACSGWNYLNRAESRRQDEIFPGGARVLTLEKVYEFSIIPESLTPEQQKLIWGGQGCLWTEYVPYTWKAEFAIFPRLSALAENLWSPSEKKDWENFSGKVPAQCDRYELWGARYSDAFFRTQDIPRNR